MHRGFIKLHRKFNDWEWSQKPLTVALYVYLLLNANHQDNKWQGITIKRGQIITGRKSLSVKTGMTEQQIRTALNQLKSTSSITIKTTNKYSIITITNWDLYQANNQQNPNKQPTNNQQLTTNKNDKNDKNDKNIIYDSNFLDIWDVWPRKRRGNKDKAFASYKSALKRDNIENIQNGIQSYIDSNEAKGEYAKGCAAWFNDDRWTNDYTENKNQPQSKGNTNGNKDQSIASEFLQERARSRIPDSPPDRAMLCGTRHVWEE